MENEATFLAAIKRGDEASVRAMLAERPGLADSRTPDGVTAPLLALYHGRVELAQHLGSAKPQLSIWEASALGDQERVKALLAAEPALVNTYAPDGYPPLGLAAFFGRPTVVTLLLAHGADVAARTRNAMQVQPLHAAAAHWQPETGLQIARALLAHGAPVNAAQQGGWTPLHQAADSGHVALAELLLAHGADPEAANDDGRRPVDMAEAKGHEALVKRLQPRRGEQN